MKVAAVGVLVLLLVACSGRQVYDAAQGWRQSECNHEVDAQERQHCLDEAAKTYDRYERQRQGGR